MIGLHSSRIAVRWLAPLIAAIAVIGGALSATISAPSATAATYSVSAAISNQNGSSATVTGYIVGQPTATTTVIRSGYPNDYALAIADNAAEANTAKMLYVQIPSSFRAAWGLKTNPTLLGKKIDVTGTLAAYFAHPGLTTPTAFAFSGSTPTTTPPTTSTTTPPTTPTTPSDYDSTYYRDALGKNGSALKTALHAIIQKQTVLSYDQVWNALKDTDEDPSNPNNVILLYSGRSQSKSTNGGGVDDWNREHVWAKSHGDFGTAAGAGTDVHHLRPEDVSVNSNRGNKDFDNGGSPAAECNDCFTDADSWEPRDSVKGDVARMLFYMAVRYQGGDGGPDLELNDSVNNGTAPLIGRLSVLKAWSAADPPDAFERQRNNDIYNNWQHNRNPFVDHPEWAGSIWG